MKKYFLAFFALLILWSCSTTKTSNIKTSGDSITIAFGSCDNQKLKNELWDDILFEKPDLWIWGGDNIYCDTKNMDNLEKCYQEKKIDPVYKDFVSKIPITGVWDDHDYGKNDGGREYIHKKKSKELFFDFINAPHQNKFRQSEGTYSTVKVKTKNGQSVQIINLDTRYFRSPLTRDPSKKKRYLPQNHGTMLGETQWNWLRNTLTNSDSDFILIVSSIQVLSDQHGFESWGNMPHEKEKLEKMIGLSKAKGVILLTGDRHIAEISKKKHEYLSFPLVDFTSSGLTHVYESFSGEANPHRIGKVINKKNFGIVRINLKTNKVTFEIRGNNHQLFQKYEIVY